MAVKFGKNKKGKDTQKTFKWGNYDANMFNECESCGAFTKTTTKRLTYWDTHCFRCGKPFIRPLC